METVSVLSRKLALTGGFIWGVALVAGSVMRAAGVAKSGDVLHVAEVAVLFGLGLGIASFLVYLGCHVAAGFRGK